MRRVEVRRFPTYQAAAALKTKLSNEEPTKVIQIRRKADGFHVVERVDG